MKYIILSVLFVGLASASALNQVQDKCFACNEFFDMLGDLTNRNLTDEHSFRQSVEFAVKILLANNHSNEAQKLATFVKENVTSIFRYLKFVAKEINPEKDCWVFFRCRPGQTTLAPLTTTTSGDEPDDDDLLKLRFNRL